MALQQLQLDKLCCSLCLDLLKDPATIPCGHSFCLSCIERRWSEQETGKGYSCPTCTQTFTPKPVLVASVTFSALVEEVKLTRLQSILPDHCYATPEDVACDICKGRKVKSVKSCLVCRASFCELHLQPHCDSPAFSKHRLVLPCSNLAQSICPRHDEVVKMFCRTDQQHICLLCSMDEHKHHDTVSAAAERTKKLNELKLLHEKLHQTIKDREKDIAALQVEIEAINDSADKTVKDSEQVFKELQLLIENKGFEVKAQIICRQEMEVNRVKTLQEKLEQEILALRQKDAELEQLADTHDYTQFFCKYQSLSCLCESPNSSTTIMDIGLLKYFSNVTAGLTETRDNLLDMLSDEWAKITQKVSEVDVLLPVKQPSTREDFLQYARQMTLDPDTVNSGLLLSEGNRKVTVAREKQCYADDPDRFTDSLQVLSRHSVSGRCYWEVDIGKGAVSLAVSYKSIPRMGDGSAFGSNDKSWALNCFDKSYYFRHNNTRTFIAGSLCDKVGVYVDHRAGTLSYYGVSKTMTLLHTVQTEFIEPLHAGLGLYWVRDSAQMCKLN